MAEVDGPLASLGACGVLPILVVDRAQQALQAAEAVAGAGLTHVEVALRTPESLSALEAVASLGSVVAGVGTVLTVRQVRECVAAGARYVLSPGLDRDVVRACQLAGVEVVPGVATATELQTALALGVTTVKLFPAVASGGLPLLRALADVFPQVAFVPTGGIRPETMAEWLSVRSVLAVGGTWLATRERLAAGDYAGIEAAAREAVALAERARLPR